MKHKIIVKQRNPFVVLTLRKIRIVTGQVYQVHSLVSNSYKY